MREQGNSVGAQSDIMHFGGRNLGALGGALLGAQVLGTAGFETGPIDVVIGGVGAIGGAFAGEKLADAYDRHRIYNQTDAQGMTWNYNPAQPQQGWTRDIPPLPDTPHGQHFTADPVLANRLTFQANNTAVDLALAHPAMPRDPYTQPAGAFDTPSRVAAPWTRDAQTLQWSRLVTDRVLEHGVASTHVEQADPPRAAQLEVAAQEIVAANVATSPRGIAERYQAMYAQRGWAEYGAMPTAVTGALQAPATALQASDGHAYTRGADGQWSTPGRLWGANTADGNLRNELDATQRATQATMPAAAEFAAPMSAHAVPGQTQTRRSFSDPGHPQHALFNTLREAFPAGTSDARLHQATAACYTAGIHQPQQLSGIAGSDSAIYFRSSAPGGSLGQMDITRPAPDVSQTMQQVQQIDQQHAQMMGQIHAQNTQVNQQAVMPGGH